VNSNQEPGVVDNRSETTPTISFASPEKEKPVYPKDFWAWTILVIGVAASLFQLYTGGFGIFSSMIQRSIHWLFMSVLAFLIYRGKKNSVRTTPSIPDIIFALLALFAGGYIFFSWEAVVERMGMATDRDIYVGIIMVIVVLEATRRAVGGALAGTALVFLLYAYFGPWMPGIFTHKGYSIERLANVMFTSTEGIYGIPIAVSSTYIVLFVRLLSAVHSWEPCRGRRLQTW